MSDFAKWQKAVVAANNAPAEAPTMLQELPKSVHLDPGDIAKVTYVKDLGQLILIDQNLKKTTIPSGKEQAEVFAAIRQHLGGVESEEEADVWSVLKGPLFTLSVIGVIGGFAIYFTTICDPNYVATGRRAGMKTMLNWLGYKIGPVWMSVAVGLLAALVIGLVSIQLVKRPIRQVLEYSDA
ncbi:MAG: hypothetical protein KDA68_20250 [Planctomycetaceae bacterium]|nr:hypothetical protein [Planctomycetaceae bacterium]